MKDCIFCKIIKKEIPSYLIYEDDEVEAFLDLNPVSYGHTLLIPKRHFKDINDIDSKTVAKLNSIVKKLANLLVEKLNADGITITQNNGYGQEIKHYHIHLIPRYENDKITIKPTKKEIDLEKLKNIIVSK